jgi:hypothetical protein
LVGAKLRKSLKILVIVFAILLITAAAFLIATYPHPASTPPIPTVSTTVSITQFRSPVWANEPVHLRVEIDPLPPTANDTFTNFVFTVTSLGNHTENIVLDANNSAVSFPLGGSVIDDYFNLTGGFVGSFTVKLSFLGQTFANTIYLPSENETSFTATLQHAFPSPSPTPTPASAMQERIVIQSVVGVASMFTIVVNYQSVGDSLPTINAMIVKDAAGNILGNMVLGAYGLTPTGKGVVTTVVGMGGANLVRGSVYTVTLTTLSDGSYVSQSFAAS